MEKQQKKCRCRRKCYRQFKCYKTKSDNETSPNTNKKGRYAKINDELVRAKKCMKLIISRLLDLRMQTFNFTSERFGFQQY